MVSIVVPVYNVETYIYECLNSILKQSYSNLEIILIDDGSIDKSGQICDEYAKRDNRIKVIHKENGGLSSARNVGIEVATGSYITFIDSDDYITKDMIEKLLFAIKSTNAEISVCQMTKKYKKLNCNLNNENICCYTPKDTIKFILTEKQILTSASAKLYKTNLFENIRYPNNMLYEDLGTTYKLVDASKKIAFINDYKYYYRTNPDSITQSNFTNKQLDYYTIASELYKFIEVKYPEFIKYIKFHSTRISISFYKKISISKFNDRNTIFFLVKHIRAGILPYMFSKYKLSNKLYGLLIAIAPNIALKIFNSN